MDNKTLVNTVAERMGCTPHEVSNMIDGLVAVVREKCSALDSIAVPGFGSFEAKKKMERIATHPATGKRILIPPKMALTFKTSAVLKQKLRDV